MSDVFDVLATDHAEIKQMLEALQQSPSRGQGATEMVLQALDLVAERLVMESSRHEAAEEEFFWPVVRQRVPNGDKLAEHGISQETEAKKVLAKLDKIGRASCREGRWRE